MLNLGKDIQNMFGIAKHVTVFMRHGIKDHRKRMTTKVKPATNTKTYRRRYTESTVMVDGKAFTMHSRLDYQRDIVSATASLGTLSDCIKK